MDFPKLRETERPGNLHGDHRQETGFKQREVFEHKRAIDLISDTGDKKQPVYTDFAGINSTLFEINDSVLSFRDEGDRVMEP